MRTLTVQRLISTSLFAVMLALNLQAQDLKNLGLVSVRSVYGHYLQAHYPDGEMHASHDDRYEEETWFLVQVDQASHIYALYNYRNGKFMSRQGSECVPAASTVLGQTEKWVLISGHQYGLENVVAFQSVADGTFLGTQRGGIDTACGGEVNAVEKRVNSNPVWPGWWAIAPATKPQSEPNFLQRLGDLLGVNINPADVVGLLASLL